MVWIKKEYLYLKSFLNVAGVNLTEKYLGDIDFSPTWNIRRKPEYMKGDKTDVIYNFYDDTAQSGGNVR